MNTWDARMRRVLQRLSGPVHRLLVRVRERGDDGLPHLARDGLHRLEVAGRTDGEAGLNDVDVQPIQLLRYLHLLFHRHPRPGGLFSVPERGVEDEHSVFHRIPP